MPYGWLSAMQCLVLAFEKGLEALSSQSKPMYIIIKGLEHPSALILLYKYLLVKKRKQFNACNHQHGKVTATILFPDYFQNNKQTVRVSKRNWLVKMRTVKCLQGKSKTKTLMTHP